MRKSSFLVSALVVALAAVACVGTQPGPPPPPQPPNVVVFGDSNAWGIGCSLGDDAGLGTNPDFPCTPQGGVSARNETEGTCSITTNVALLYNHLALPALCNDWASKWPGILDETAPKVVILNTGGWEIVDRWSTFPAGPNCSQTSPPDAAYNCPEPDLQWGGDQTKSTAAENAYKAQLNAAIDLFRSKGAKVLVVNSPYYAPQEAQVPGLALVWYEAYPQAQPANWSPANANVSYRNSKTKIDEFNTTLKSAVDQRTATDPNVQFFDLWSLVSPNGQYSDVVNGVVAREQDHVHFSHDAYQFIIMPALLPVIQQMLS